MWRTSRPWSGLSTLILIAALALGAAACGGDGDGSGTGTPQVAERAFLTGMVHHHQTAIDMANIARERADAPFIKALAEDILSAQDREISQMRKIYTRLIGGRLEPDPAAHDGLGLSAREAGMTHTPATSDMLRRAKAFDRAFVDEMVPHHEGAVKMAQVLLDITEDGELRELAESIISTQQREIEEMNEFRTEEYGEPVPEKSGGADEHGAGH